MLSLITKSIIFDVCLDAIFRSLHVNFDIESNYYSQIIQYPKTGVEIEINDHEEGPSKIIYYGCSVITNTTDVIDFRFESSSMHEIKYQLGLPENRIPIHKKYFILEMIK